MDNKILFNKHLIDFSTSGRGFHIFIIPAQMGMWEGPLARRSYPRLSPWKNPCAERETTKKTCARFIPRLAQCFHQVIPEISHTVKTVWKSPWKNGGLVPKMDLSYWNQA
ncbi:hypothetical protein [Hymenobacter armeniacus]|uniref:hypothetical protein n=1 Tax=Hymenobacter armeniacus TaxID=2771358 RepID=UPI001CC2289E|nr:hypothetical protein [Hymenobacter armeniacus]